ncbi:MAG: hypothetical protein ABL918_10545 [Chakrabartia sp.]
MKFKKTAKELESVAIKWWPKDLEEKVALASVIPKLIETQDKFISILKLSGKEPESLFAVLKASDLQANIFLKHLAVVTDFGGEPIKRLGREFADIFSQDAKTKTRSLVFTYNQKEHVYQFRALPVSGLSNAKLKIDGVAIVRPQMLNDLTRDMIMLLVFGGLSSAAHLASLERCDLGLLLGKPDDIDRYIKERYIHVSRITTGAGANSLGQIAQVYVADYLQSKLDDSYNIKSNGRVVLKSYDSNTGMPFDVVVERCGKIVGIEVSFQVTSNSVIERKASNAEDRKTQMGRAGHFVAYVLDGAGNFSRGSAISTICQSSDCTVAYSDTELDTLVDFIRGKLDDPLR